MVFQYCGQFVQTACKHPILETSRCPRTARVALEAGTSQWFYMPDNPALSRPQKGASLTIQGQKRPITGQNAAKMGRKLFLKSKRSSSCCRLTRQWQTAQKHVSP
ncbi:hypothetical protein [Pararhodobacter zhoushanensis]|uniref:hypothetical protein n=1 Tax=Pararhodobacter zhoushanensis TaxID=2479545 RepID=UPI000F8DB1F1|nr:hypothetical protein [Pararhodobacter zhoushanensis]